MKLRKSDISLIYSPVFTKF